MWRVVIFACIVALAVGAALVLVTDRAAITRSGYRLAELERRRRRLIERNRQLRARVARLKTATRLAKQAKRWGLEVVPPEEHLERETVEREAR
ncbi:MAG: hypothetical protein ACLF0G_07780 [Candidatus Brocadiia bacterium]